MEVTCYHKDTCLSCYLQNHHNGDNELLIGIPPSGQSLAEAVEDLMSEVSESDKVPETVTDDAIRAALTEACEDVDFRWIDSEGERCDEQPEDEPLGDEPYVYFVLRWEHG